MFVLFVDHVSHHIGSSRPWVVHRHLHAIHDERFSLILFDLSLYFHLHFAVFFLFSFLMHSDLYDPNSVQNDLRHSAKGSLVTFDDTHSLTGYEPNDTELNDTVSDELVYSQGPLAFITPSSDQDIDDTTLGKLLTEAVREYADYLSLEGVFVSPSSVSVASDRTVKPVAKSNIDPLSFGVRNACSAHTQFSAITQAEEMVDRTGKPVGVSTGTAEERNSSSAQIRTLFNEQREMIIAECCEKVSHHELQAARAEQDRQIPQEELRRQQKDFREVHQQNLTEMEELRKFQSSTFDTHAKLIEDQNTIKELSGRLQELQNEANCMNDSKDFQDAESVRSGIHTLPVNRGYSLNILFLKDCWGFYSYRRAAKKGCQTFGIHIENRETFLQIHMLPLQLLILEN